MSNKFNDKEEMTINSIYFEKELEYNNEKYVFCLWVRINLILGHGRPRKIQRSDSYLLPRCKRRNFSLRRVYFRYLQKSQEMGRGIKGV
jgi:hypothetical protein